MFTADLHVGVGRSEVTPPLGTYLCGYPLRERPAESVADPLYATALVLQQADVKAAIISLDWVIVEDDDVETIRRGVEAETGIPRANVTVCAIQTHTGPATHGCWGWGDKDVEYVEAMIPRIVEAVVQANLALRPARVGIGTTHSDVGINRRAVLEDGTVALSVNPWGLYDPEMTVLRFEDEKATIATLVHYGAHPTAIGSARVISRDWPGVMIDRVEQLTGAPALFINGAVGDIAPRTNIEGATGDGVVAAVEVGSRAASDAMRVFRSIKEFQPMKLAVCTEEFVVPYASLAPLDEARQQVTAAEPRKDEWGEAMCNYLHWQAVVQAHAQPALEGKLFQQTITALGPVALVPFAGEPFAEIVLRLRQLSPFQYTLCASTTNAKHGYYPTREARARGGYEVWVAKAFGPYLLAENVDDVLVRENLRILRHLHNSHNSDL